jgi:rod shape-determining protein MreC
VSAFQEPFFTRGPSPMARLTFFTLVAIAIMIADHRFQALSFARTSIGAVLNPIEQALMVPGQVFSRGAAYFSDQDRLLAENRELNQKVLELAAEGQQGRLILAEKPYLDVLGQGQQRFAGTGLIAEVIRDARNPYTRKIIINKGMTQGVVPGLAVIAGDGVVGQVTAVGLMSSEITLSTEKDQALPVLIVRNGLRAIAIGSGRDGNIEVPSLPLGSDVQIGDKVVTSGIDGTYPPGLGVAVISQVEKNPAFPFAKIVAQPVAAAAHHRFVKVMLKDPAQTYPKPDVGIDDKKSSRDVSTAGPTAAQSATPSTPQSASAARKEQRRGTQ